MSKMADEEKIQKAKWIYKILVYSLLAYLFLQIAIDIVMIVALFKK
jgi:hypothetical protein